MILSEDQSRAQRAILDSITGGQPVSLLVGPAGSGKTTLMRSIITELRARGLGVVLMCPTGKAAAVLASKTGEATTTIHKALYRRVTEDGEDLVFDEPQQPCGPREVVVCDEASMVGEALHAELLAQVRRAPGARLLYVGDREQLPPVNERWGPDFGNPTAALDTVHRQAEKSPILALATAIRTHGRFDGWVDGECDRSDCDPVQWMAERADKDATLLCYTNKTRRALNHGIRGALGYSHQVVVGDRLVCLLNHHESGVMNGEVLTVEGLKRSTCDLVLVTLSNGQSRIVNTSLIGASVADFKAYVETYEERKRAMFLHVDYGFALTVHKAQGSQWGAVGFVADGGYGWLKRHKPDEARRLAYTAVTRASRALRIFQ